MNNPLTVGVLLFVKLTLDLLRIEELEQVWLKIKAREWLKVLYRRPCLRVLTINVHRAIVSIVCEFRAVFVILCIQ